MKDFEKLYFNMNIIDFRNYYGHHGMPGAPGSSLGLPPRPHHPDTHPHLGQLHHHPPTSQPGLLQHLTSAPSAGSKKKPEPETITVSDDDDEVVPPAPPRPQILAQPTPPNLPKSEFKPEKTIVPETELVPETNTGSVATAASVAVTEETEIQQPLDLAGPSEKFRENLLLKEEESKEIPKNLEILPKDNVPPSPAKEASELNIKSDCQSIPVTSIKQEPQDTQLYQSQITQPLPIDTKKEINSDLQMIAETLVQLSTSSVVSSASTIKSEHVSIKSEHVLIKSEHVQASATEELVFKPQISDDFNTLLKGIELYEGVDSGLDMLCALTMDENIPYYSSHMTLASRLDVLCCVTKGDKIDIEEYVDPMSLLKKQYNLHDYATESSSDLIQTFIGKKSAYYKRLAENPETTGGYHWNDESEQPPSLPKILKKIKNTEIASDLEAKLRTTLMELQEVFRKKQSLLGRLKSPRKKYKNRRMKRTPKKGGATPTNLTKKITPKRRNSHSPAQLPSSSSRLVQPNPPNLEPTSPPRLQSSQAAQIWKQSSALLKPPKLTASLSQSAKKEVLTDLSSIKAR